MAVNPPLNYGLDLACVQDADEMFSEVSGLDTFYQDQIHRITTNDVLGPDGDGWGLDCRMLLGMKADQLKRYERIYEEVLTRDARALTASVTLTPIQVSHGLSDVLFSASGTSTLGPWSFVKPVSELTLRDLEPA